MNSGIRRGVGAGWSSAYRLESPDGPGMHNRATASLLHRFRGGLRKKELSFEDGVERTPLSKAVMRVFQPRQREYQESFGNRGYNRQPLGPSLPAKTN